MSPTANTKILSKKYVMEKSLKECIQLRQIDVLKGKKKENEIYNKTKCKMEDVYSCLIVIISGEDNFTN